ncbi:MAG: hypothetical protein ACPG4U_14770 [Pseudomonadales bacterium]
MIIESSEINSRASHSYSKTTTQTRSESLSYSVGLNAPSDADANLSAAERFSQFLALTEQGQDESDSNAILVRTENGLEFKTAQALENERQKQVLTATALFQSLMRAISLNADQAQSAEQNAAQTASILQLNDTVQQPQASGEPNLAKPLERKPIAIELSVNTHYEYTESEELSYNSAGSITTADGKSFSFDLALNMQRSFSYTETTEFSQVTFVDPLIINYPGEAADLDGQKFAFDLDADGDEELISYLNSGAMLALDKNQDGVINDGTELFGALTGNGFAELAAYDEDGNNFIDEADSIFDQLQLWRKSDEIDSLTSLKSQDIGAIYLGATDTPFAIKDDENQQHGQVRSSSFYLTESGEVGSVQQVDMVV